MMPGDGGHVGEQGWDAETYDRSFGYVSRYGRELTGLLAPVPGERMLDLGCGTGELAAALTDLGIEVCGIDADAAMIAQARVLHPEIRFEQADGHDFVVAEPVDAILSNAALHWMLDPSAVIARVRAALRPGGRFVAEFGGQGNVATIRTAIRDAAEAAGVDPGRVRVPWFFPSPAEYARLLEDGGLRVRRMEYFDRPTALDDCADGIVDWLRMFGTEPLAGVPPDLREQVMRDAAERCRPALFRDGRWHADYVRLRVWAVLPERSTSVTP
jgi:trans-aconitate methyltransferase